ncbi:glycosyltransferase [Halorubrum sp. F4]|uniref:glycosyltransferase n=1 Tax=Halorubrum sp. F4 TaxID=2989715 RepID=UPI0024805D3F|nr:glycosyltransferase [Halorubrum sp. F4]
MDSTNFSLLIAVYEGENPVHFSQCLESIINQEYRPTETVIVKDGSLTDELEVVIDNFRLHYDERLVTVELPENQGAGKAYDMGLQYCSQPLVAQIGADDIAAEGRFEKQVNFLRTNPDIDVVGGYIEEFENSVNNVVGIREVPLDPSSVERYARFRSPINHTSVMFRKDAVLEVGGFRDLRRQQDYDLWVRLLMSGYSIANIPEILAKARVGESFYERKGGILNIRHDVKTQWYFYRIRFISPSIMVFNILSRLILKLVPNRLRSTIYKSILRE